MDQTEFEIACLKTKLKQLDDYALQYLDGKMTDAEYEPYRQQRVLMREQISWFQPPKQ